MKNRFFRKLICCMSVLIMFVCSVPAKATGSDSNVDVAQNFIHDIITYQLEETGTSTVQEWIDGYLAENAGQSSEWYVIGLSQYGEYDFSAYETSLIDYLAENEEKSASSRQKYALALLAVGSDDEYISQTLNDSIGEQGVMSLVYGLHLLNNGCVSDNYTAASVIQELLVLQLSDGGWAIMGENGDVDVTAMTVQALAPHYEENPEVKEAVDKALIFLSEHQLETGDYSSYGVPNPESTSQVIAALSSLGIDCQTDERFIKNGNTLIDSLEKYCSNNGAFGHKEGEGYNAASTVQVFYSLVAYVRMTEGKAPLYLFDSVSESDSPEQEPEVTPGQNQESSEVTPGQTSKDSSNSDANEERTFGAEKRVNYKPWATLIVVLAGICVCVAMYFRKNRDKKNYAVVGLITLAAVCLVWLIEIQSVEEYRDNSTEKKTNVVGEVTITVRCNTIVGNSDNEYIPEDGVVLEFTEILIEEGDTVYDVLSEVTANNDIHLETSGSAGGGSTIYVEGINHIYEFDYGDLSGWMYFVNGEESSVGCSEYELEDGDKIEWLYTCEMGKDLK